MYSRYIYIYTLQVYPSDLNICTPEHLICTILSQECDLYMSICLDCKCPAHILSTEKASEVHITMALNLQRHSRHSARKPKCSPIDIETTTIANRTYSGQEPPH